MDGRHTPLAPSLEERGQGGEVFSYDVWGRRRNNSDFSYTLSSTDPLNKNFFDRFYTGHETLPLVGGGGGLINMNGRMYDGSALKVGEYPR
jgi:hypothetical protein